MWEQGIYGSLSLPNLTLAGAGAGGAVLVDQPLRRVHHGGGRHRQQRH